MKILVIDDSADAIAVAKARLAHEGHDILCAAGGREGLDIAARDPEAFTALVKQSQAALAA